MKSLRELLTITAGKKLNISEERVEACIPIARKYVAFWRKYPDLFVDWMCKISHSKFSFFFYQRIFLRAVMRYQYTYMVFPRAYSKSFLSIMVLMIQCILYPGAKLFVTSGGKEQSAGIIEEKVNEICDLIPAFRKEIDWKKYKSGKDKIIVPFKNGSWFDNLPATEKTRGKRRHGKKFFLAFVWTIFNKKPLLVFCYKAWNKL